ncbi:MAG: hypothetical protein ACK47B_10875 [Armatimonadota bacterium]
MDRAEEPRKPLSWWDISISGRRVPAQEDVTVNAVVRRSRFRFGARLPWKWALVIGLLILGSHPWGRWVLEQAQWLARQMGVAI